MHEDDNLAAGNTTAPADWIDARVAKARGEKSIPEGAVTALKDAMRGQMADRTMPAGDLQKLARVLLSSIGDTK